MKAFEEVKKELNEIKQNPEILNSADTEMEKILKEIIKIERRYLYGLDSSSAQRRKAAVFDFITDVLKNKGC